MAKLETWENPSDSTVSVIKTDSRGNEKNETVPPHQKFSISEEDRVMNQDRAASPGQDLFKSGLLIPYGETIRLLNGDETEAEMASSPNMMSDSDLQELFKLQWRVFPKKVAEISSVVTLSRLEAIGEKIDATVKQMKVINDRIVEIDPSASKGENVVVARAKSTEGITPRGLDGDDEDYKPGRG